MIKGTIVGTVIKSGFDTNKSGKQFAKVRIESVEPGVGRDGQQRDFKTRVDVQVYGNDSAGVAALTPGTIVWADGKISARVDEYQGKTYAKLVIMGKVGVVSGNFDEHKQEYEKQDAPRQTQPQAAPPSSPKASTLASEGLPPEEDDVPF